MPNDNQTTYFAAGTGSYVTSDGTSSVSCGICGSGYGATATYQTYPTTEKSIGIEINNPPGSPSYPLTGSEFFWIGSFWLICIALGYARVDKWVVKHWLEFKVVIVKIWKAHAKAFESKPFEPGSFLKSLLKSFKDEPEVWNSFDSGIIHSKSGIRCHFDPCRVEMNRSTVGCNKKEAEFLKKHMRPVWHMATLRLLNEGLESSMQPQNKRK